MTIHLPPEIERSLIEKVHSGVFPSLDAAITHAAHLLLKKIEQTPGGKPKTKVKRGSASTAGKKPLTTEALHQKLLAERRISRLPDTAADYDAPDDEPIAIEGEPLSETIIRERR
jgi:hypothetical protein